MTILGIFGTILILMTCIGACYCYITVQTKSPLLMMQKPGIKTKTEEPRTSELQ